MKNNNFFGVRYDTWKTVCNLYLNCTQNHSLKSTFKCYLQSFPFSKITEEQKHIIESEEFFNDQIATGAILCNKSVLFRTENYITKNSGGFRNSYLISPFLYLIEQSIALEVFKRYKPLRDQNENINVLYSGNFEQNNIIYKNEYNEFAKWNTYYSDDYPVFIKTDLSDYYSNLNINKLLELIQSRIEKKFTPVQAKSIKDILTFCGKNKFPLIENSVGSSYLATVVYLDEIDTKLGEFINKLNSVEEYKLLRYVDDLYIWLKPVDSNNNLNEEYCLIRSKYSSILHDYGLTLNTNKTGFFKSSDLSDQLKKNLYEDIVLGKDEAVELYLKETDWSEPIKNFLKLISSTENKNLLNKNTFDSLLDQSFKINENSNFSSQEILKYIIYDNISYLKEEYVIKSISDLLSKKGLSFMYLMPTLFTTLILNTRNSGIKDSAVKAFLSALFQKNREQKINSYDITIIISYLVRTNFCHRDLIEKIVKENANKIYEFSKNYCLSNFFDVYIKDESKKYINIINGDWKTYYLFFNYKLELDQNNYMEAYAFYKTYFDRLTTLMARIVLKNTQLSFTDYYKAEDITDFYSNLLNANLWKPIKKANELRSKNPLVHSSSEFIGRPDWQECVSDMIKKLNNILQAAISKIQI